MSSATKTSRGLTMRDRDRLDTAVRLLIALLAILFAMFPVVYIFSASINPVATLATTRIIPENPTLDNYRYMLDNPQHSFPLWVWNSIKVSGITSILVVALTALAAYSFSRFRFRLRKSLLQTILLAQVFPNILAIVALFLILQQIGRIYPPLGLNSHGGLILVYLGGAMGINIWLMKGYFDSIPRDIDESAMVDGATHWQIFTRLLLPLMRPIIVVVGILTFIFVYGDFVMARILLKTTAQYPVTVGLWQFTSNQFAQNWGLFAAGALMAALPIMIIYLLLQDQIVGGLTQGSVKG